MTLTDLQNSIQIMLHQEIEKIQPYAESATTKHARQRLTQLADNIPAFLTMLAEPWLSEPISSDIQTTLEDCAKVHLCLRVIDDAIDENLPIHRQNLLYVQPLYWRTFYSLGARYPDFNQLSQSLIIETVVAVAEDDKQANPKYWGAKNHHLLLAPLLLSGHNEAYQHAKEALSMMMAFAQAEDEWAQGEINHPNIANALLALVTTGLSEKNIQCLHHYGWHRAAQRLVNDGRHLVSILQQTSFNK
jgi:hypothetical protein